MNIYDCIMYRGEADVLEFRLTELADSPVYRHVIVESPVTHRGDPKPLYFAEQALERFAPWMDKITYVASPQPSKAAGISPWDREHAQRNAAWTCRMRPDDVLLISDVDEIPSPAVWDCLPVAGTPARVLMQRAFVHAVDWQYPTIEPCSVLATAAFTAGNGNLAGVRDNRDSYPAIQGAGWHFGWLGDHASRLVKLGVHCHLEGDSCPVFQDEVRSDRGYRDGWHAQVKLLPVDVDDSWPRYIRERRCPDNWFRPR